MCGIVGYVGGKQAAPLLLEALEKLEYRGYDSSGIAVADGKEIDCRKAVGRLRVLQDITEKGTLVAGQTGIGHTRWATHGEPSDVNSHPHMSTSCAVAIVHNGIIENYAELRNFLEEHGYAFVSDTDTEIAAQLLDFLYKGDPLYAVRSALNLIVGSYALGILFADYPDRIYAAKKDSPLIVGLGEGENFIASDIPALLKHTRNVFRLGENELAVIMQNSVKVFDRFGDVIEKETEQITWDVGAAEKGGYAHFMIKEIMEQADVIRNTINPCIHKGNIDLGLKSITDEDLRGVERIFIIACGSAYHAGAVGRICIERYARVPVTLELASEFRYLNPLVTGKTLVIVISQSGETIDTLLALREARARGARVLSIVNVVGTTIANESEDVIFTRAGLEIAVATTKAYSAQLTVLYMLALHIAACRGEISDESIRGHIGELENLGESVAVLLQTRDHIQYLASLYAHMHDVFFIGRHQDYALALEGSLKLKEISYIHSEAYAAGELKHGTISLVEDGTLVIALCTYEPLLEKMISNMREVKARGATVIALAHDGLTLATEAADHVIYVPRCAELVSPSLSIIPLQLFAYYVALLKGCDIDKPRNLAKSVTVE